MENQAKPFYKSKTVIVYGMVLAGSILTYVISPEFPVPLTEETVSILTAVLSAGAILLRVLTKSPIKLN